MTWQTFVFFIIASLAFAFSGYRFRKLILMMKAHQGRVPKPTELPKRVLETLVNVLGQKAVMRKKSIGIAHALIFWGFLIITIGTLEQFGSTLYQGFSWEWLFGPLYSSFLWLHDAFTAFVLIGVLHAAYRRYIVRPPYLGQSRDADFVLLFTSSLMVSIFLMHGFMLIADPAHASALPISARIADLLASTGISAESATTLGQAFKWVHMLLVLGFGVYIPGSKHLHVLAAGPNTFLKHLPREKGMTPIDFTNESITQYGAAKVTDLSWKDALDYYSCTECGRCQEVCPAHNTQKPLSPKNLILDLKDNLYRNQPAILTGKLDEVTPLMDSNITEDVIWACTSCRACEVACPVFIQHTDKIYEARRNLVMMESRFPAEVQTVFKNMETNASPWAFPASDRAAWAEGLGVKTAAEEPQGFDVLLWVGCAGSFDDRNKKVLRAFVSLLKKAGIRFAILGSEEQCTGDPARRIGNEYLYQTLAQANVETLNRYAVKRVVTACPHCFNTIKNEYGALGGQYEVFHHTQFLAQLVAEGKLKPTKAVDDSITFHDSCYLGRWNGIYNEPRSVLQSIPSARLIEMKSHHEQSMCCGAGGGRMFMEEKIGKPINVSRTEQAIETKAGIIASSCPFCMTMMTDGVKAKELQGKVKVMDLAELLDQSTL